MMKTMLLAQGKLVVPPPAKAPSSAEGWGIFLLVIAILVLPFVLGNVIANALKMKHLATRISIVLLAITLGISPFVMTLVRGDSLKDAIRLGIDLAGGTNMVFVVDHEQAEKDGKDITEPLMNKMVEKVKLRVNPTGTEEVTVRRVGADRIEVIVPGADAERVAKVKRDITELGNLEFALLANTVNHQDIIDLAADPANVENNNVYRQVGDEKKMVAMWRPVALDENKEPKIEGGGRVHSRATPEGSASPREYLVVVDPDQARRITGRYLVSVREQITERGLAVGFTFNERGGYLFGQVTSRNRPQEGAGFHSRLAVLLNGSIHSAPQINGIITTSGQIDGNFTREDIDSLLGVLSAGALDVPLDRKPVTEFSITALLGEEVQRKGFTAIGLALVVVFIFTLVYYMKSGFVADVCLALNIILVLGAMSLIDATFTLPGLAGLVLTIGMAVDANVLIFERMREEQARGSSIRMSIKNGFEKAFSTIFDANITTLLTAIVLYYIGTDQIKGFAVTLFIGILTSMFSALFIGRLIFDIAEQKRWLKDLKMMSLINPQGINFLGKKQIAAVASLVLIVGGLVAVGMRGSENLDIDFRGGSMVTFKFVGETPETNVVKDAVEPKFEDAITLEQLSVDQKDGTVDKLYRLRTVEDDTESVSAKIKEAFADSEYELIQQHVTLGVVEAVVAEATEEEGEVPAVAPQKHQVTITVSEPMTPAALADIAAEPLKGLNYGDADDLVEGAAVTESETPKVSEIQLTFSSLIPAADIDKVLTSLKTDLEKDPHFEEVNKFDKSVTGDAKLAAITAMAFSLLAIVAYLWVRFQRATFGLAACAALIHDVLVVLGLVAIGAYLSGTPLKAIFLLEDFKINLPIIAAFLTIVGYSLNDTIVVFDRIREVRGRNPALTEEMVNASLNQTLSRTILTSLTTLIVVFILYVMGGEGIHGFAYCLILGILVGTYSSIYVASPVLVWLMNREQKKVAAN
ncbi:protein translocase subunit SecD [Planctomicrobium sp.]|nr:protein translocase subunit SecD [Planctomicrobium sp.]